MNEQYYNEWKTYIETLTKDQAIKELENLIFLLKQDNYIDRPKMYALEKLLDEVLGNE